MKHAQYPVDILDEQGEITGQKPRYKLDKHRDIYHGVHVVVKTPNGELVLSRIPQREDLPNLYAGLLGTTMATVRHTGETAQQAARRGLLRELLLDDVVLTFLREGMVTLSDGRRSKLTAYLVVAQRPELYLDADIGELVEMESEGLDVALTMHPDRFAPTFRAVWPSLKEFINR